MTNSLMSVISCFPLFLTSSIVKLTQNSIVIFRVIKENVFAELTHLSRNSQPRWKSPIWANNNNNNNSREKKRYRNPHEKTDGAGFIYLLFSLEQRERTRKTTNRAHIASVRRFPSIYPIIQYMYCRQPCSSIRADFSDYTLAQTY